MFIEEFLNFLTFRSFITPYILMAFYYVGAIIIPLLLLKYHKKILKRFNLKIVKIDIRVKLLIFTFFIFAQIIWRMVFEFMIAYFQMHDKLMKL